MELFQKLNDEGVTVVMITHDANIAEFAQRKVMIYDGVIVPDLKHGGLHAHKKASVNPDQAQAHLDSESGEEVFPEQ